MINENFKIEKKESFVLPEGVYPVELIDVTLEEQPKYKKPEIKEKVFSFEFGVLEGTNLRKRRIWFNFVPIYLSIGSKGKNKLYKVVEALLGQELTREQEAKFEAKALNKLIGLQCMAGVEKKTTNQGKLISVIESLKPSSQKYNALTDEEKTPKDESDNPDRQQQEQDHTYVDSSPAPVGYEEQKIRIEDLPF